jgi:hypothetical protein
MADGDVKAYNFNTGDTPALIGPSRSRIKNILVYGTNVTALTLKNGTSSGTTLLDISVAAGWNEIFLPDDGILAKDGVFFAALTGSGSQVTLLLA